MGRSVWKVPLVLRAFLQRNIRSNFIRYLVCRSHVIPLNLVGKRVKVYNGRSFVSVYLKLKMVGYKFGEFCVTKILGDRIALGKREKLRKKLNKQKSKT